MTLSADNLLVQGFWSGPLTTMERLSMRSFLSNGHEFHLYSYGEIKGIPEGAVLCDAAEIVPESEVATFRCAAQFSDYFRIALLYKKGGWYVDLDTICLQAFQFYVDYCFYRDQDESTISFAVSKSPAGSPLMQHCYDYLAQMDPEDRARLDWQEIGSDFACGAVEFFKMTQFAQPGYVFDPIHWTRVRDLINPVAKWDLSRSYAAHLFHAAWNKGPHDSSGKGFDLGHKLSDDLDTDVSYHSDCLYEQLKRRS
jgi:hypothetical protein